MPKLRLLNLVRSAGLLVLFVQLGGCNLCGKFFRDTKDIVGLAISPLNGSVQPSNTQQYTATGTFTDNSTGEVTTQTIWTSSNPAIATINSAGLATGVAYGNTTISGDCQCYVVKTTLTVSNQAAATITSIAVTPATTTIATGGTQQFVATATYSNNTTQVITTSATWTSSDSTIATITGAGLATGVGSGSATITATSGSVSGTATLTVQ